jgi:hypothetical protein
MAAKLTRLTLKIAIQLHLVAESYTVCSSRSRRPVRELFGYTLVYYVVKPYFPIGVMLEVRAEFEP